MRTVLARLFSVAFLAICLARGEDRQSGSAEALPHHEATSLAVESFLKVWETIRDTHFDTNFNGVDWNAARDKFLPRVEEAKSPEGFREITQEMLDLLGSSPLVII